LCASMTNTPTGVFADEQQEHGDFMRALASEALGIDMEAYPGGASPNKQAADYYREVIDFVQSRPDQYGPGFETAFQRLIQKLDPPTTD
jgi:hypothetical protein